MPNKEEVEKLKKCINNHHEVMDKERFVDPRGALSEACFTGDVSLPGGRARGNHAERSGAKLLSFWMRVIIGDREDEMKEEQAIKACSFCCLFFGQEQMAQIDWHDFVVVETIECRTRTPFVHASRSQVRSTGRQSYAGRGNSCSMLPREPQPLWSEQVGLLSPKPRSRGSGEPRARGV